MDVITLPVSLGEALDKQTILEIKMAKISDERRADCAREFEALDKQLKPFREQYAHYYKILLNINTTLWDIQDRFHGKNISDKEAADIARLILLENDRRFRVKLMINTASGSPLREQKGYKLKKVFLYSHLGLGDMFWMVGAVRYLATAYDQVVIVCKERNKKNVEMFYSDLATVKIFSIEDDYVLQPFQEKKGGIEAMGFTVLSCGYHTAAPRIYEFPLSFYDDLDILRDVGQAYFHVPTYPESVALWTKVTSVSKRYVVVHQQSSVETLSLWEKAAAKNPDLPILDINKNHYPEGHKYFEIAAAVTGQPMLFYKNLLEGAYQIYCIESSMYCFASHLDLSNVLGKYCYNACDNSNLRIGVFASGI